VKSKNWKELPRNDLFECNRIYRFVRENQPSYVGGECVLLASIALSGIS
jgi:hypothetical protein